jgi:hypothetical protein
MHKSQLKNIRNMKKQGNRIPVYSCSITESKYIEMVEMANKNSKV